ncbi:hypothetical protein [Burkholderia sp. BCC1972]|uniref:hypothetical protein n=1 Tax=Burkholderia sp. BCC1972 TaxID=2817438 RepID=UPI002ABDB4F4|nr:hypothetical protein [Burkholderia sp. BCC1972]
MKSTTASVAGSPAGVDMVSPWKLTALIVLEMTAVVLFFVFVATVFNCFFVISTAPISGVSGSLQAGCAAP